MNKYTGYVAGVKSGTDWDMLEALLIHEAATAIVYHPVTRSIAFSSEKNTTEIVKKIQEAGYELRTTFIADIVYKKSAWILLGCFLATILLLVYYFSSLQYPVISTALAASASVLYVLGQGGKLIRAVRIRYYPHAFFVTLGITMLWSSIFWLEHSIIPLLLISITLLIAAVYTYLEEISYRGIIKELEGLYPPAEIAANMLAYDGDFNELIFAVPSVSLQVGDLLKINSGEIVPADGKILNGNLTVTEKNITGGVFEKTKKDTLLAGTLVTEGSAKLMVTAIGHNTVFGKMLDMEQDIWRQLCDQTREMWYRKWYIILLLSVVVSLIIGSVTQSFYTAFLSGNIVLIVGNTTLFGWVRIKVWKRLVKARLKGIQWLNIKKLSLFSKVEGVVFNKTGTITTGKLALKDWKNISDFSDTTIQQLLYSIEREQTHAVALAVQNRWKHSQPFFWVKTAGVWGGIEVTDKDGNVYRAGNGVDMAGITEKEQHKIYLTRNKELLAWFDFRDEPREGLGEVLLQLKNRQLFPLLLTASSTEKEEGIINEADWKCIYKLKDNAAREKWISRSAEVVLIVGKLPPVLSDNKIGIAFSHTVRNNASIVIWKDSLLLVTKALQEGVVIQQLMQRNLACVVVYHIFVLLLTILMAGAIVN